MFKNIQKEYFSFTRKERTGIIVLLACIVFFLLLPFLFPFFNSKKQYNHQQFEQAIASLQLQQNDTSNTFTKHKRQNYYSATENKYDARETKYELFNFDPNTLPASGWEKLGLREKTIHTILNYIKKGGRFYQPTDIGKIWGLHPSEIERLLPFVVIHKPMTANYTKEKIVEFNRYEKKAIIISSIDINLADTTAFIALPGIGSKLANRIVAFREKLGGFTRIEQVAETYALPDSTFMKIKNLLIISQHEVKQFNINTATADEMKIHPYIRYNIAAAIIQYRSQHGLFKEVSEIKNIMMVTDDIFKKLQPYLSVK